ncbi:MAG: bifunctional diguanylate cyclase/phosphodiesterase [Pseudomonadota bacterium]
MSKTTLIEALPDVVLVVRRDGRILDSLGGRLFSLDIAPDAMIGRDIGDVFSESVVSAILAASASVLKTRRSLTRTVDEGDVRYEIRLAAHGRERVLAVIRDASAGSDSSSLRLLQPDALVQQFVGREQFIRLLDAAVSQARLSERSLAVVCVDFDGFEPLIESMPEAEVDSLISHLGERCCRVFEQQGLRTVGDGLRDIYAACRLSRVRFAVLLPQVDDADSVDAFALTLGAALSEPLGDQASGLRLTPNVAVAMAPQDGGTGEAVLSNALTALEEAGALDTTGVERYADTRRVHSERQQDLAEELRWAIDEKQLRLHYQPVFALSDATPVAMEAYLRWQHPLRGALTPGQFLPLAEATGQIQRISDWVLRKACTDNVSLARGAGMGIAVVVNFSRHYFSRPDLIEHMVEIFDDTQFDSSSLILDITERMLMRVDVAGPLLARLKSMGIGLQVDNFGSGYSSLKQIRRLPLDALKIDGEFVAGIGRSADDEAICQSIIQLAHSYGLRCVAEAVESRDQVRFLRASGCDDIQGNLFGPEMTLSEIEIFIEQFKHGLSFSQIDTASDHQGAISAPA